jgi:hypothetical protein
MRNGVNRNKTHRLLVSRILDVKIENIDLIQDITFKPLINSVEYKINNVKFKLELESNLDYICLWDWFWNQE